VKSRNYFLTFGRRINIGAEIKPAGNDDNRGEWEEGQEDEWLRENRTELSAVK